jgi:thiopeptide-type bacteriocin biosynthesis protein
LYRWIDAAVVRAAAFPGTHELPPWPDLSGNTNEHVIQWRRWLAQVWADEAVAEAIELASPALAHRVRQILGSRHEAPRQMRRVALSVARYLLRMTSRATPFGLFAGVAPARFAADPLVEWGRHHRPVARPDAVWLTHVVSELEARPELLRRLPVVVNDLCYVRGGRLVVPCQQQPAAGSGWVAPAEVSVRYTKVVAAVVRLAQSPVRGCQLAEKLAADFPRASREVIDRTLVELVARRVLLTSLRAPMTVADPLEHLVDQLGRAGAHTLPGVAHRVAELRSIREILLRHNRTDTGRRAIRAWAGRRMAALYRGVEQPVVVDLRLDCTLVLPEQVAREAERAASTLARLTPHPFGFAAWRDYHIGFLERYGSGALVPVRELTNPDVGLGLPAGYRDSVHTLPPQPLSDRDVRLLGLAQRAALDGARELVLDDAAIATLATAEITRTQMPAHTELSFHLQAPTREALKQGEFTLVVASASRAAGTLTGRFLDLLDDQVRVRMAEAYAELPTVNAGALPAQLSCPPLFARTENLARSTALPLPALSVSEHPVRRELIPLNDLAVGGDAQGLYLVSLSRRRAVEPVAFTAVESANAMHPLARFLIEISKARAAAILPFDWGAARTLPFLPRLRHGRIVLAPARWTVDATDLPGKNATQPEWQDSFSALRGRLRLPDAVFLGQDDRRIRLELDEAAHLHLLRAHLDRAGSATLTEAPQASAAEWFDGHAHEIVVPLASTAPSAPAVRRSATFTVGREHGHLPGASQWLYVKLYGHPGRQAEILTAHVPGLVSDWDEPPGWWYVRYQDPHPHLRLRFRLPDSAARGQALHRIGTWVAGLRRLGLASHMQVDTYFPETGRYGTGRAMAAAEALFAADSAAAVAQLGHATSGRLHPHALTAASFLDMASTFTGSVQAGTRWLIDELPKEPIPAPARELHDTAVRLADTRDDWATLRSLPGGAEIATAWTRRRTALLAYRTSLAETDGSTLDGVLPSLLHMHHIRVNGIDENAERLCRRLARAAALSWTARTRRGAP